MVEDVTTFLESPWVRDIASSRYMVELLRYLRIGRKVDSILAKFNELPQDYLLGALEALESLGVVKSLSVSGNTFYVLSSKGKLLLSYIDEFSDQKL